MLCLGERVIILLGGYGLAIRHDRTDCYAGVLLLRWGKGVLLLLLLVVQDIHELLQNFFVFGVNTHVNLLIVFLQGLFLASTYRLFYLFGGLLVGGEIEKSFLRERSLLLGFP